MLPSQGRDWDPAGVVAVWFAHARISLQRQLVYRFANWSGLFTNCFFLYFRAYALAACFAERTVIGGLDVRQVVSYVTVSQALLMVIPQWGRIGVADAVRSGQIAIDLARPVDYVGIVLAQRFGVSGYYLFARAVPLLVLGAFGGFLEFPSLAILPAILLSIFLAAWIAHLLLLLIELSSFWFGSERGVRWMVLGIGNLLSGLILPISFFPDWAQAISRFLPFEQTLYVPTRIWIGDAGSGPAEVAAVLGIQLSWALLLTVFAQFVFHAGRREVLIHGG